MRRAKKRATTGYQKQLELLKLMGAATRKKLIVWRSADVSVHEGEMGSEKFGIRFKYPLLAGDEGSDREAVEVSAGGAIWTFYIGTEGFDLASKILEAAYPQLRKHNLECEARMDDAIKMLRKQLRG